MLRYQSFVKVNLQNFYTTNVLAIIGEACTGKTSLINQIANNNLNWQGPFYQDRYDFIATPCPTIYTNRNISPQCSDKDISIFDSNLNFICYYTPKTKITLKKWTEDNYDGKAPLLKLRSYFTEDQIMIIHVPKTDDVPYFCIFETQLKNFQDNINRLEQETMFRIEKCLFITSLSRTGDYDWVKKQLHECMNRTLDFFVYYALHYNYTEDEPYIDAIKDRLTYLITKKGNVLDVKTFWKTKLSFVIPNKYLSE